MCQAGVLHLMNKRSDDAVVQLAREALDVAEAVGIAAFPGALHAVYLHR